MFVSIRRGRAFVFVLRAEEENVSVKPEVVSSFLLPVDFICIGRTQRSLSCTHEFSRMRETDGGLFTAHSSENSILSVTVLTLGCKLCHFRLKGRF